jgi:hypothetical protein
MHEGDNVLWVLLEYRPSYPSVRGKIIDIDVAFGRAWFVVLLFETFG